MNSLSWMIYGVGVVGSLWTTLCIFAIIIPTIYIAMYTVSALNTSDAYREEDKDRWRKIRDGFAPRIRQSLIASAVLLLVMTALPSRQTMLLVAGSEIGQRVITSEQVQSVTEPGLELLRTWMREETTRLKGKSER